MSMKSVSYVMSVVSIIVMLIYTYNLLLFIQADRYIWSLWALSMAVSVGTSIIGLWARDEYYADQFKGMMKRAA